MCILDALCFNFKALIVRQVPLTIITLCVQARTWQCSRQHVFFFFFQFVFVFFFSVFCERWLITAYLPFCWQPSGQIKQACRKTNWADLRRDSLLHWFSGNSADCLPISSLQFHLILYVISMIWLYIITGVKTAFKATYTTSTSLQTAVMAKTYRDGRKKKERKNRSEIWTNKSVTWTPF